MDSIVLPNPRTHDVTVIREIPETKSMAPNSSFFQLHGNIAYTFDYRARLDTPFAASNLQQHNEQIYANAILKGKFPFRLYLNSRQSNSPYFRNFTDINIDFNHRQYQQGIKDVMIADMIKKTSLSDSTRKFEEKVNAQREKYFALKNWIDNPARTQEIVEEKERLYRKMLLLSEEKDHLAGSKELPEIFQEAPRKAGFSKFPGKGLPLSKDSLSRQLGTQIDSIWTTMHQPGETEKKIKAKKGVADSLYKMIQVNRRWIDSIGMARDSIIKNYAIRVSNARSVGELKDLEKKAGTHNLGETDKRLLSITHFSIGRSSVNYSDLTVSNISLNGLNVEYNPSYYAAFAVGSVDYLFRDFIVHPGSMPRQNLVLGRFGWGDKEKRVFIFTAYGGTKNNFGGNTGVSIPSVPVINTMHIFGYSLEAKYKLTQNADFSIEGAKSSSPYTSGRDRSRSINHAFSFSDRNNEAISAKFNITIPSTHSTINLFYKNIGANFQSFSIFNYGNKQEGWGFRLRQYLFRDRLSINLQIKKSNFDNPLLATSYSTSTYFKSLQVVYRKKKWPVFSAGYMPSSQLIRSPAGILSETIYYALTAGIFYDYQIKQIRMNSSIVYSRFYNHGTDSGFVLYNASTIQYTHNLTLSKVHMQTDFQYSRQPGLRYWVSQQRADLAIGKILTVGAGLKNSFLPDARIGYWGGSAEMNIRVGSIGSLRVQYSKDYIPNGLNGLVSNDWGRAVWVKVF
ncbi:hypothetical protein ACX0G9_08555 [Flavitalea flava]